MNSIAPLNFETATVQPRCTVCWRYKETTSGLGAKVDNSDIS